MKPELKAFCIAKKMPGVAHILDDPEFSACCDLAQTCLDSATSPQAFVTELRLLERRVYMTFESPGVNLLRMGICLAKGCPCPIPDSLAESCIQGLPVVLHTPNNIVPLDFNKIY